MAVYPRIYIYTYTYTYAYAGIVGGLPCWSTPDKTTHLDRNASALDGLVVQLAARHATLDFVSL